MFHRFFTENPTYQSVFPTLKDIPLSEIHGNKKIQAHANNVLYAITSLVDNLDDTDCLVEMLKKLGGNHGKRGIQYSMFVNLGSTIVGLLKDKLGPQLMDDFAITAWTKTYGVIISVVKQGLDETKQA
jgi:hemoglobin-like flavoprotein